MDAIQEALQLLESVRPESQEQDCLLDDKAQALLWLYICTLEAKMQEVSGAELVLLGMDQSIFFPGLLPLSWCQSWFLFQSLFFPNQGIERDRRAQAPTNMEEFEVNDLNYEDKLQEDRFLYSNIAFNLAADSGEGSKHGVDSGYRLV